MKKVSRRKFVIGSGTLVGAAVTGLTNLGKASLAEEKTPSGVTLPLPGPIPAEAYQGRIGQVVDLMKELKIDAILLPPGIELEWLTGLDLIRTERPNLFILTAEGKTSMSLAAFQQDVVAAGAVPIDKITLWEDNTDPFGKYLKVISGAGLKNARVGLGAKIWYNDFARIHGAYPKMKFVSVSAFVDPLREVKSIHEKDLIVSLSNIADDAIRTGLADVREGMTEREIRQILWSRLDKAGVEPGGEVLTGPNSAEWFYAKTGSRALVQGDAIVVTLGARLHGYWGSATRQAVLGKPTGRMMMIWELVLKAREEARLGTLPEMSWSAVFQKARAVLSTKGFGKFVDSRMGQGIGVSLQEFPYVSKAYHTRTSIGNIVQFEPGIHTPGEYGVRSSILMEVGRTVGKFLTEPQESIIEV